MADKKVINLNPVGAYRIRSGEARPVKIEPVKGPVPKPTTTMPPGVAKKLRELAVKPNRS